MESKQIQEKLHTAATNWVLAEKIEIEVPKGTIAKVTKGEGEVRIIFREPDILERIKTFDDAYAYLKVKGTSEVLLNEFDNAIPGSYSEAVCKMRIIIAALTDNEKLSMTKGDVYYPFVQFCKIGKEKNCCGSEVVGTVLIDGEKYHVVGGSANYGPRAGLGYFDSGSGVSYSSVSIGFRSVSTRRVAEYISKQFGRLVFEIMYGGCNADWKWTS